MEMALVDSVSAAAVPNSAIIVLPLATPVEGAVLDFTYLAASDHMFVRVNCRPQPRLTYGHCLAFSNGTVEPMVPWIGAAIKFSSVTNYLVAKPELVDLLRDPTALSQRIPSEESVPAKRACLRQLDIGGELADDVEDKPKGTSTYLLDLEGVRRATRNKTDIPQREKDTHFVF